MPWTGSAPNQVAARTDGTRTGDATWQEAAAAPVGIEADDHDVHDSDMKDMVNACLKKDGGNTATANIPMGGFTLANISAAGARTEPARFSDVQDNKGQYVATVGGTADVITLTPTIAVTAYAAGQRFSFIAGGTNTGATTVNVSGLGAKDVVRQDGSNTALSAGDITSGTIVDVEYDGTRFLLLSLAKLPTALVATAGITSRSTSTSEYSGERYAADTNGATLNLSKSRHATSGSQTVVQSGDVLGAVQFNGSDGTNFENAAGIHGVCDGTPGNNDMPGGLVFYTTADGATSGTERMAIRTSGKVQIPNRSAPLIQFDSTGYVDQAEISSPSSPASSTARIYTLSHDGSTTLAYKNSGGTVILLKPASQSNMVTGTDVDRFVSPGRQHFHPAHPKATARGASAGGITGTAYNVTSISRGGTGQYTVTLTNAMADTNYWVVGSVMFNGGSRTFCASISSSTVFTVEIRRDDNAFSDHDFAFSVYGASA